MAPVVGAADLSSISSFPRPGWPRHTRASPPNNQGFATQHRRSTSMLTRKKSIKSRTRRARRKQSKFVTPDLVLSGGKLMRFVAGPDDPLSEAERLRGEFAQMEADHDAEVGQFLQRAYFVAVEFRWRLGDFERFQVHPFWKQTGHEAAGPVDLEVGPLLDHASDHAGHGQSRRPVCRDPGRIEAGPGGGQRSRRPHPRAGRDSGRVRSPAGAEARRRASFRHGCGCGDGRGRSPNSPT